MKQTIDYDDISFKKLGGANYASYSWGYFYEPAKDAEDIYFREALSMRKAYMNGVNVFATYFRHIKIIHVKENFYKPIINAHNEEEVRGIVHQTLAQKGAYKNIRKQRTKQQ